MVMKLRKVGTTLNGYLSHGGSRFAATPNRTDATTFTRMGIIRAYAGGGVNARMRIGRFNVVEL